MVATFTEFIDITGANASKAPLVKGGLRAYYATGSDGIEETAAQVAAAKAAGMGVVLIDQTPSLSVFAAGLADVADVETSAGTPATAAAAVAQRQAHGWQSTLYTGYGSLSTLTAAITNATGVVYWVADWSWSLAEAEDQLNANADWAAVQYGDPSTNPDTLVPGTNVTLADCQADIDVAKSSWASQFLPDPKPAFAAPGGLSQTVHRFVDFAWGAVAGAASYHFQVVQGSKSVVDETVTATHLGNVVLAPGDYSWRVAVNATSTELASPWTAERAFTV